MSRITVEDRAEQISDKLWDLQEAAMKYAASRSQYERRTLVREAVRFTNLIARLSKGAKVK